MTPDELRGLARVMRELGIFKLTTLEGVTIEMSAAALAMGAAESLEPKRDTQTALPAAPDEDDPILYAATEGMPD